MTDRHLAALSSLTHGTSLGGSRYYESHLATSASTMTTTSITAPLTTTTQATMQYQQQQALQQRLLYQQQQQQQQQHQQQQRYYASSYQLHPSYAHNYAASAAYSQQQQQHPSYLSPQHGHPYMAHAGYSPYDAAYHSRLLGCGSASYNRSRYSPYHQQLQQQHEQHQQSLHGLYTAAGQQLVPTSVLHYPPKNNAAYQAATQQQREEQILLHHQRQQAQLQLQQQQQQQQRVYEQQQQQQLQQRTYLHNLNDATYNPYRISQHHYQQAQMSLLTSQQLQQQQQEQQNRCFTPRVNEILSRNSPSHTLSAESNQLLPNKNCSSINDESNEINQQQQQQQHRLQQQQPESCTNDCTITTSPPLISASGTDSGISSSGCSTRGGTRTDSTQSTPVYSGEYPLSVGSSSGISYHFVDGKELEDSANGSKDLTTIQKDEGPTAAKTPNEVKQEITDKYQKNEMHCMIQSIKEELKNEGTFDTATNLIVQENHNEKVCTKSTPPPNTCNDNKLSTNLDVCPNSPTKHMEYSKQLSSRKTDSSLPTNSSPKNEELFGSLFVQTSVLTASQNNKEQQPMSPSNTKGADNPKQDEIMKNPNDKWSPFPSSPNGWAQSCSPKCETSKKAQILSPTIPAPPHNSPVDYQPRADPVQLFSGTASKVSNKKNIRIKKTKLKKSVLGVGATEDEEANENEQNEDLRNITPLPGFQQAFGSTEIGRFSETFLLTPDDCNSTEHYGCYDENQQQQPTDCYSPTAERYSASQNSWTSFDPYLDYANSAQIQYSMRYATAAQNDRYGLGYRAYDRHYGLREAMLMSERFGAVRRGNTNFNEIRCNGY